jgi:light-regulated signal transduction histidine kinase (bacteriophytochrome)
MNKMQNSATELILAYKELAFEIEEKGKRAAELVIANVELAFQNNEKEKRAAELAIANKELAFQNAEKEQRAAELITANKRLAFENDEKEKRAAELVIANKELLFQNLEKEKAAIQLISINKDLEQLAFIASHDLQEPLRTISNYMKVFKEDYIGQLDVKALSYLNSVDNATARMSSLIKSLLNFSKLGVNPLLKMVNIKEIIQEVIEDIALMIKGSNAVIEITEMPKLKVYETELRLVFQNLICNAIKFSRKHIIPTIIISSKKAAEGWIFTVSDNGIGIAPAHFSKIFDIFQRLNVNQEYEGTGIGLAICKKLVQMHRGKIFCDSVPGQGTKFHFSITDSLI